MSRTIVSMTTTYERLPLFYYSVQSILYQDLSPDKIVLNISHEPYLSDSGITYVPEWIKQFDIEINFVENIGPYRKLLPTLNKVNDSDIVVTADDDVIYHRSWLHKIIQSLNKSPKTIVSGRARMITRNVLGHRKNYTCWPLAKQNVCTHSIIPTGIAGIAYTKNNLDLDFLNDRSFLELAPTADDLWFKVAAFIKNTCSYVVPSIDSNNIYLKHNEGLENHNINHVNSSSILRNRKEKLTRQIKGHLGIKDNKNDVALEKILRYANVSI